MVHPELHHLMWQTREVNFHNTRNVDKTINKSVGYRYFWAINLQRKYVMGCTMDYVRTTAPSSLRAFSRKALSTGSCWELYGTIIRLEMVDYSTRHDDTHISRFDGVSQTLKLPGHPVSHGCEVNWVAP